MWGRSRELLTPDFQNKCRLALNVLQMHVYPFVAMDPRGLPPSTEIHSPRRRYCTVRLVEFLGQTLDLPLVSNWLLLQQSVVLCSL